jgi:hypothetical protein
LRAVNVYISADPISYAQRQTVVKFYLLGESKKVMAAPPAVATQIEVPRTPPEVVPRQECPGAIHHRKRLRDVLGPLLPVLESRRS